jgi:chromosome segregation ATPase
MSSEDAVIIRELATLAEAMRNVQGTVADLKKEQRAALDLASQARARLYQRLEEVGRQNIKMEGDIADVKEDIDVLNGKVEGVKTVTDKVTRWQLMAIGVVVTVSTLTALLGGMVATYWAKLRAALGL